MEIVSTMSGEILGMSSQNSNVFKSNWLHVVIFRVFFINLRCTLKRSVIFLQSWTSTGSSISSSRFSPFIDLSVFSKKNQGIFFETFKVVPYQVGGCYEPSVPHCYGMILSIVYEVMFSLAFCFSFFSFFSMGHTNFLIKVELAWVSSL